VSPTGRGKGIHYLVVPGAPAAKAATGHRIDVGYTILQGGYWKGSGSYNNYDGVYRAVCVGLWFTGVQGAVNLSVRCVDTPKGGGYAFSAPSVRCRTSPGYVWTRWKASSTELAAGT
jgi:hypothetical protein